MSSKEVYGFCPICGAKGVSRERRIDGNDTCENGHTYKSQCAAYIEPVGIMSKQDLLKKIAELENQLANTGEIEAQAIEEASNQLNKNYSGVLVHGRVSLEFVCDWLKDRASNLRKSKSGDK